METKQHATKTPMDEREKPISYINAYMWNLEKWYK